MRDKPISKSRKDRVLLVEDSFIRELAVTLLERAGFEVDFADNGADALQAVQIETPYDIVLMDLAMPVMDGYACTRAIRSLDERCSAVPIFALTASRSRDTIEHALEAGMDGYLAKPYSPSTFAEQVRSLLTEHRQGRPASQGFCSVGQLPVRDFRAFDEICKLTEDDRIDRALVLFGAQIDSAIAIIDSKDTISALAFETHRLIASAGMLGFEELRAACDKTQTALRFVEINTTAQLSNIEVGLVISLRKAKIALRAIQTTRRKVQSNELPI